MAWGRWDVALALGLAGSDLGRAGVARPCAQTSHAIRVRGGRSACGQCQWGASPRRRAARPEAERRALSGGERELRRNAGGGSDLNRR
eukprot:6968801-Prymnesium_polylepis.2